MSTLEVLSYRNVSEELKDIIENAEMVSGDDVTIACAYQNITRDWIEIYQLYRLFDWNYRQYREGLCIGFDGSIGAFESDHSSDSVGIAINGFVTNYVSAGRNLADSMEGILKADIGKESVKYKKYKQVASGKYDKKQAYYFLYELRNYVQHGQSVMSTYSDGRKIYASLNLGQLRDPAHFNAKPKIIDSMNKWAYQIEKDSGPLHLSLGHYVEEYNYEIRDLFLAFLDSIREQLGHISKQFFRMLKEHPSYIQSGFDGSLFVLYKEGETVHLVNIIQDRVDGRSVCEREALIKKDCRKAKKSMKEWNRHRVRVV